MLKINKAEANNRIFFKVGDRFGDKVRCSKIIKWRRK